MTDDSPQPPVPCDPAEERARISGYSARSESEPRIVRTVRAGRVDHALLSLDGGRLAVCWRYPKHSDQWRLAGWLVPDGKMFTAWTWDRATVIGPVSDIEAGIKAVAESNASHWLGAEA